MPFNPLTLVATLVGGLLLAGLLGWIRKPRLIVLVPKQFSYSQISDRGHLVEISVLNRGFKTEDTVEVILNNALRYELLGANSQDATVAQNKISIPRIGPSDDVTVLLLVEGGPFKRDDIVQCLSKETKGTVVAKLEEVPFTAPQRVTLMGIFVAVSALLYGLPLAIDYAFEQAKVASPNASATTKDSGPIEFQGWKIPRYYQSTSQLLPALTSGKIQVTIGTPSRSADVATVPVKFTNQSDEVLDVTVSMNTAGSPKRFKSYELRASGIMVMLGKSEERSIRVVIPQKTSDVAERRVYVDVHVNSMNGDSLSLQANREVQ